MEHYYQPEIECASREEITRWQSDRQVNQVRRVYENVPYYRQKMADLPDEMGEFADAAEKIDKIVFGE